jgi:ligand-binding sensor domain-containing protein
VSASGFLQNSVQGIFQDRDGLLWVGTQVGLNCFDGRNFKTCKHPSSGITTIIVQFILSINQNVKGY